MSESRGHVSKFVEHYRQKADSNKRAAKVLGLTSIAGSASVPVLLLISIPIWVAAAVSAVAAVSTAWLQLRKHAERWALYRTAQRDLEKELHDHQFSVGVYRDRVDADALLVERANARVHEIHYEWVPTARSLQDLRGRPPN